MLQNIVSGTANIVINKRTNFSVDTTVILTAAKIHMKIARDYVSNLVSLYITSVVHVTGNAKYVRYVHANGVSTYVHT